MVLLCIGGLLLASWVTTALMLVRDIRRERRDSLDRLNIEYRALCAAEPPL
jgi:hypothetical protein